MLLSLWLPGENGLSKTPGSVTIMSFQTAHEKAFLQPLYQQHCPQGTICCWKNEGLTQASRYITLVHMGEQSVQQSVQSEYSPPIEAPAAGVAAPMVERAFRLLEMLSISGGGLTLSDLARGLGMSKSSVHGLLKTLEGSCAVEQSEERRYVLGPRIFDLARAAGERLDLRRLVLPVMRRLADSLGQTVFLGRLEQERVRILECLQDGSERPSLHISARRGARIPMLAGATARVVLASWQPEQREEFLRTHPLPRFTEHSITDPAQFLAAVEETAQSGIGEDRQEYLAGVNAVAAPITGAGGTLVALLWVVGFAASFGDVAMRRAAQQLRTEAGGISRAGGAR